MKPALSLSLLLLPVVGLLFGSSPLGAQGHTSVSTGDRVRVQQVGTEAVVGSIVRLTPDSLTFVPAFDDAVPRTVARGEIAWLEVSRGSVPAGEAFLRGAGIGGLVGGAVGYMGASATYEPCAPSPGAWGAVSCVVYPSRGAVATAGAVGGGLLGGILGGVIGLGTPRERWQRVDPPRITISPAGTSGTFTLSVVIPR